MSRKSIFHRSYYFPKKKLKIKKPKDDKIQIFGIIKIKEKNETDKS